MSIMADTEAKPREHNIQWNNSIMNDELFLTRILDKKTFLGKHNIA